MGFIAPNPILSLMSLSSLAPTQKSEDTILTRRFLSWHDTSDWHDTTDYSATTI
jgi:hypothetical protein